MYASPRYSRSYGGYSPSKYYHQPQEDAYSPPLKTYAGHYYQQQQHHNQQQYYHQGEFYHSSSSTASSSQDGYYADDLDDVDEYANPELSTVPTVPTPMTLSKYELGKTPSGRVLVTHGNQTVEFFAGVVNAPIARCVFVHE